MNKLFEKGTKIGITDKNGKEIKVGDKIKFRFIWREQDEIGKVEYIPPEFMIIAKEGNKLSFGEQNRHIGLEVIEED